MTDDPDDETGDAVDEWDDLDGDMSTPDTDPRHIGPAGDLADAVESGGLDLSLAADADAEDLRGRSSTRPRAASWGRSIRELRHRYGSPACFSPTSPTRMRRTPIYDRSI
jgi:hypothetical protein